MFNHEFETLNEIKLKVLSKLKNAFFGTKNAFLRKHSGKIKEAEMQAEKRPSLPFESYSLEWTAQVKEEAGEEAKEKAGEEGEEAGKDTSE